MDRIDPITRRRGTEPVEVVRPVLLTPVERELERERREAARREVERRRRSAAAAAAEPQSPPQAGGGGLDLRA